MLFLSLDDIKIINFLYAKFFLLVFIRKYFINMIIKNTSYLEKKLNNKKRLTMY